MKKKLIPLNKLKKRAWDLQSKFIRSKAANFQDLVECYTCLKMIPWKESQLGHYIHNHLDYEEGNLKIQCVRCNHFLSGNLGLYGERLIKEHGYEFVLYLRALARKKGNDYSRDELNEVIKKYS